MSNNLKTANVRLAGVLATLLVIAISEVGVTRLHAQGASATLLGTVTDATGAPPAEIVIVSPVASGVLLVATASE